MGVAVLILEKEAMVFLFAEGTFQESSEEIDKSMDLLFREALAQEVGKFRSACKLQKDGERLLIELLIEAKTDLLGIKDHGVGRKNQGG